MATSDFLPLEAEFEQIPAAKQDHLLYDDFERGLNGWMDLHPNYVGKRLQYASRYSHVDKTQWGPLMLSSASFRLAGTHGSMDGTYSLKLSTRPVAILTRKRRRREAFRTASNGLPRTCRGACGQYERGYAYTPEQDRQGPSEQATRAFGVFFDIQDDEYRYFICGN